MKNSLTWNFTNRNGDFRFNGADLDPHPHLYFPLTNEAGLMSAITPDLKGDIKTDQNHFLMPPVSSSDIYASLHNRNFWIHVAPDKVWSCAGLPNSKHAHTAEVHAGILWHKVKRVNKKLGLAAEITNFVPATGETAEIMTVKITNVSLRPVTFTPTSAIPIYGRSADNLRDHRHVTSLLNRIRLTRYGIILRPLMSFDERGHKLNNNCYYVFGCEEDSATPAGFFPTVDSFINEGGSLISPDAVFSNLPPHHKTDSAFQGQEAMGAVRFNTKTLIPDQSVTYILLLGIEKSVDRVSRVFSRFNHKEKIDKSLSENITHWRARIDSISFFTGNSVRDNWLRWVTLQPILRKIFGCSFLPDFDYGRGGKGWRDLWQDCLTLILIHPQQTKQILLSNFGGIRVDGSNATIITKHPGRFLSDRNKISRVWTDHGVWPFFTLRLFIDQTGDYDTLFHSCPYFYDQQLDRAAGLDQEWRPHSKYSYMLHTKKGRVYEGTVLEHILIQHLVQFFNVGRNNNIRLEDADWNDGLDMAAKNGESVAFTCFYAANIRSIAKLLTEIKKRTGKKTVRLANELLILLDTSHRSPVNYEKPEEKKALLQRYFNAVRHRISGEKRAVKIDDLIRDLERKWESLRKHVTRHEWIQLSKTEGIFNGYYDNRSRRVEGKVKGKIKMTLTGQVFPILSGIATDEQIQQVYRATVRYLKDKRLGGFRLNTDFGKPVFDLGRAFAFSYGDKENGAIFSHMCVMFAAALYGQGFVREGFSVLESLFKLSSDVKTSRIYPCLPEYFNRIGRGLYSYLTGSASWYILTLLTEAYGIRGHYGDLIIRPKLVKEQFADSETISLSSYFAERRLSVIFRNHRRLDYGQYKIVKAEGHPKGMKIKVSPEQIIVSRDELLRQPRKTHLNIEVILD